MNSQSHRIEDFNVSTSGTGIPFVWGHCLLGCIQADNFAAILDFSAISKHSHLIRYDAIGHGESRGSNRSLDYRWTNQARDMWAIADRHAPGQKIVLGGASMGCAAALYAALEKPQQVAGLVLVLPPTAWNSRPRQVKIYRNLNTVIGLIARISGLLMKRVKPSKDRKSTRQLLAQGVLKYLHLIDPACLKAALEGAMDSDLPRLKHLYTLDIPTIILTWDDDSAHPLSTAITLNDTLPDVRLFDMGLDDDDQLWSGHIVNFLRDLESNSFNVNATTGTSAERSGNESNDIACRSA